MKQTAEEYLRNYVGNNIIAYGDITHIMIEFAKLHVEAALKAASDVAFSDSKYDVEHSYPLENIK